MSKPTYRLYDFERRKFLTGVMSRSACEKEKTSRTRGSRSVSANWIRTKIHPVQVTDVDAAVVHACAILRKPANTPVIGFKVRLDPSPCEPKE